MTKMTLDEWFQHTSIMHYKFEEAFKRRTKIDILWALAV